jgi:predicted O-methyltransferase YrrM
MLALVLVGLMAMTSLAQPAPGERRGPPPHPLMTALDADKDGAISAEEIQNAPKALKSLDANGDGRLAGDEASFRFRPQDRRGPPPGGRRRRTGASDFESDPVAATDTEKKILAVLSGMRRNESRGMMNVPAEDGRLLRLLAEAVGAKHVVEIGTSNGYSGIWFCLALRTTGGKLTTYEIDARRAGLARQNFKQAGVDNLVTLIEGNAHDEVPKLDEPIDVIFLDADKEGYIDYLEKLLPHLRPGGLILAHNMNTRQADPRYVKAITTTPDLETLFLHMDGAGVGVTLKKRPAPEDRKAE